MQPIWLADLRCVGTERDLRSCDHSGFNNTNCRHSDDVGLRCGTSDSGGGGNTGVAAGAGGGATGALAICGLCALFCCYIFFCGGNERRVKVYRVRGTNAYYVK